MKRALVIALAVLACSCTKASESSDAKRMPKPPPAPSAEPEGSLKIEVEIDGARMAPIDAAKLNAVAPDFHDEEHRAWRLATLVGPSASRAGATISVTGTKDVAITMKVPNAEGDPMPVLSLNRRGEAMAGLVPAEQPFPAYHGQGGRLSRPGDPLPRIVGVTKIKVETRASP